MTSSTTVADLVGIARKPHPRRWRSGGDRTKTADTAAEFGLRVMAPPHSAVLDLVESLATYAVELAGEAGGYAGQAATGLEVQGRRRLAVPLTVLAKAEDAHNDLPDSRPRRLRARRRSRRLVEGTDRHRANSCLPISSRKGYWSRGRCHHCRGWSQRWRESLRKAARPARTRCTRKSAGVVLFGVPHERDEVGSGRCRGSDGVLDVAIRDVIAEVGDACVVISDLCSNEFTSHGALRRAGPG